MVRGVHRKSIRRLSVGIKGHTRKQLSEFRFGTSYKSGIEEAQYLHSLPERQKLRSMQENQDYKGSLQEAHCWCSASCRKFWWLDDSRSQSPQWRRWISKQSPIRDRGTRFSYSVDTILSVQNQNVSGNGKEFTKVLESSEKPKVILYRQFLGIWQILWRIIMESLYINASTIRDEWHCWESGTHN